MTKGGPPQTVTEQKVYWPVIRLTKEEVWKYLGYEPTDAQMERIMDKLADALMECGFWDQLQIVCEEFNVRQ